MLCDFEARNINIWKFTRLQEMRGSHGQAYQEIFLLLKARNDPLVVKRVASGSQYMETGI